MGNCCFCIPHEEEFLLDSDALDGPLPPQIEEEGPFSLRTFSISDLFAGQNTFARMSMRRFRSPPNKPIKVESTLWRSLSKETITLGQVRAKRDMFWEESLETPGTKPEVWLALRSAVEAAEHGDLNTAQAIVDDVGLKLPTGSLSYCLDQDGGKYIVPVYMFTLPINLLNEELSPDVAKLNETPAETGESSSRGVISNIKFKVRIHPRDQEEELSLSSVDYVDTGKRLLAERLSIYSRQRWIYAGRILENSTRLDSLGIQPEHIVQAIFCD